MRGTPVSIFAIVASAAASVASAQSVLTTDLESRSPVIHLDRAAAPIATQSFADFDHAVDLTLLRMQGADLSLLMMDAPRELPDFNLRNTQKRDTDWEESPLVSFTPASDGLTLGSEIRFDVGRTTSLRDGGIAGTHGTIPTDSAADKLPSFAQSEGEYDLYDLALSWDALDEGPIRVSLTSGIKAIDGRINKRVTTSAGTSLQDAQRVALLPVIGTGVEWSISDRFSISGNARTHPIAGAGSIIDINAMTAYRISNSVDLSVGYSLIRSSFDIGSVATELTQEGLFARLQISF